MKWLAVILLSIIAATADGSLIAQGAFENPDKAEKAILWKPRHLRTLRLQSTLRHLTASELTLIQSDPPMVRVTLQRSPDMRVWQDLETREFPLIQKEFFRLKIESPP